MDKIGHVSVAPVPLVGLNRSARPRNCLESVVENAIFGPPPPTMTDLFSFGISIKGYQFL